MTPHGKINNNSHNNPLQYKRTHGAYRNTTARNAVELIGRATEQSIPQRQKPLASPIACHQPQRAARAECQAQSDQPSPYHPRIEVSLHLSVRSCVGSEAWANHGKRSAFRPVRTLEHLFQKTLHGHGATNSERLFAPCGRTSRRSTWRSARAFRSAARNSLSTATASRTLASRLWSISRCSTTIDRGNHGHRRVA